MWYVSQGCALGYRISPFQGWQKMKTAHGRRIEATDREIDRLVYESYGVTEEEIALVEGAVGKQA